METSKSIKVRHDTYDYGINETMTCYTRQKESEEAISKINKGTESHAEMYQNKYAELNEGSNKKAKQNNNYEENKRNEINYLRQNQQIKN